MSTTAVQQHKPLRAKHAHLTNLLRQWLGIDDWSDDLIAPAALVKLTREAVGEGKPDAGQLLAALKPPSLRIAAVHERQGDTVLDRVNGLEWQASCSPERLNFSDAEAYCKQVFLIGGGWRLPTRAELLTICSLDRFNPAIDTSLFPDTKSAFYWSSTPYAGNPADCAWGVNFDGGSAYIYGRDGNGFVRAVRSVAPPAPGQ